MSGFPIDSELYDVQKNNIPEHMLTTVDNPYDPFDQFDDWYHYDTLHGYNSCSLLERIAKTSDEISEFDRALEVESAIDEIVKENVNGLFKRVTRKSSTQH